LNATGETDGESDCNGEGGSAESERTQASAHAAMGSLAASVAGSTRGNDDDEVTGTGAGDALSLGEVAIASAATFA
jgi:hypothetical protein